ncbi:unnamed protein product [Absidia cylindrospora]
MSGYINGLWIDSSGDTNYWRVILKNGDITTTVSHPTTNFATHPQLTVKGAGHPILRFMFALLVMGGVVFFKASSRHGYPFNLVKPN